MKCKILRTILLISKFFLANMNDEEIGDFLGRFQPLRVLSLLHVGKLPNSIGSLKQPWYMNLSESSEHRFSETVYLAQLADTNLALVQESC